MSKSREEKSAEAQDQLARAQRTAGERQLAAGQAAEARLTAVGKPTTEETTRRTRYRTQATTPGETLMTQAGPISMAVSRRIAERVETPGMDYDPSTTMDILGPELWRGLKQRGIAPRPGAEPGLGGEQYMRTALPYLAKERETAISRDIERGRAYGEEARGESKYFEELLYDLSEALRGREVGGVTTGAPYGIEGEEAYGAGMVGGAQTEADYAAQRAQQQKEKRAAEGEMIRQAVELALIVGTGGAAAPGVMAGRMAKPGGTTQQQTPYARSLQSRLGRTA